MSISLTRIPLLLLATAGLHRCLTNPNPPVPETERKTFTGSTNVRGNIIVWWPNILKCGLWIGALCESLVILATNFSHPPLTDYILATLAPVPSGIPSIRPSPLFLLGTLLALFGSLIRSACYRALGAHFTYQLSFRRSQPLVTGGPYAYVRHPSYSAFLLAFAGMCACWFGEGSWLRECGVLGTVWGSIGVGMSVLGGVGLCYVCTFRPVGEDRAMRSQFGEEWDEWASRVPYRLVPYVY